MQTDDQPQPAPAASVPSDVVHQLVSLTRALHDTLAQLGVMGSLQNASVDLPDARSRLRYVVDKAAEAATKVLNSVDAAKAEQAAIAQRTGTLARMLADDPLGSQTCAAVTGFVAEVQASTGRVDAHLTDIMLAQDFHDLTSQVLARVLHVAGDLEDGLVRLLVQVAPPPPNAPRPRAAMRGPAVNVQACPDVVASQGEVDDLLASLGF